MVKILTKIILGAASGIIISFIGILLLLASPNWGVEHLQMVTLTVIIGIVMMVLGIIVLFAAIVYGLYKLVKK